jgi:hypothetical protein
MCGANRPSSERLREEAIKTSPLTTLAVSALLGGAFGFLTAPGCKGPMFTLALLVGIPTLTFAVAAPSRLSFLWSIRLFAADVESAVLQALCVVTGRSQARSAVSALHAERVELAYASTEAVRLDPERFHHARRMAMAASGVGVLAAMIFPATDENYTYGVGMMAVSTFSLDLLLVGLASRFVAERVAVRLTEVSLAMGAGPLARARQLPLMTALGATLGSIGGLIVVLAGAAACAVESTVFLQQPMLLSFGLFLGTVGGKGLTMGMTFGAIFGAGLAWAQPKAK